MYPGFKELIQEKSEISLGTSYWDAASTKLSIPRHPPSSGETDFSNTFQPDANSEQKRNAKKDRTIMLSKAKTLKGYKLNSLDGEIGEVKEFYFDDQHWTIRYLVAAIKEEQHIAINLTKKQIEDSPSLNSDKPVSRQFEEDYYGYYGWPMYWDGPYVWGSSPFVVRDREKWKKSIQGEKAWDLHLRSTHDVSGHHIQAADGEIGHVEDFIIDDETWAIRYLIIDTRNWWPGKKVLVSPQWIERVSWSESKVFVNLSRETIKQSPEYTEESLLTRDYEIGLHGHYNRKGYWIDELAAKEHSR